MADGHAPAAEVAVLVVFGSLGLIGAVFSQRRAGTEGRALAAAMSLALLNATVIAVAGRRSPRPAAPCGWPEWPPCTPAWRSGGGRGSQSTP